MEHVPLNKLTLGAQNMRTHVADATEVADLIASIEAHGLLNPLVVTKGKAKAYSVIAGGRRLRALEHLANAGKLPNDHAVPVRVVEADDATELSIVENFVRSDPKPYEYYRAFAAVQASNPDVTAAELAKRFGMETARAERILRLGNLHPEIFDAYATGRIKDEEARAFAATADTARQLEAWDTYRKLPAYECQVWKIRKLLGMADGDTETMLRTVGLEAYEAAGGTLERDLFSERVRVENLELLEQLFLAKQRAELEAVAGLCSRPVEILDGPPRDENGYTRYNMQLHVNRGDHPTEQARIDELTALGETDEGLTSEQDFELDALLAERPFLLPDNDRPVGINRRPYGGFEFYYLDAAEAKPAAPDGEAGEAEAAENAAPAVSRSALERMAMMRRERLIERTQDDMMVHADALDMLVFIAHRTAFMGARNSEARGFSTCDRSPYHDADWNQEPDHAKAWALFRGKDTKAIAAAMLGRMTTAKHAGEQSPFMDWIASMSAPKAWVSTPEFWELFRKGQILDMVREFSPAAVGLISNMKQGDLRAAVHDLCNAQEKLLWKGLTEADRDAALAWTPTWLTFPDEQNTPA